MKSYQETQKITSPWLLLVLYSALLASIVVLGLLYFTAVLDHWESDDRAGAQILCITFLLIALLFLFSRLETKIDRLGVYVRFLPILVKWRFYPWEDIKSAAIRKYSPLMEYGGWGFRIGIMGQGNAYTLSGKQGLQLEFKNGKKLLIGTKKEQELSTFLKTVQPTKSSEL